jgi:hypothetical protein
LSHIHNNSNLSSIPHTSEQTPIWGYRSVVAVVFSKEGEEEEAEEAEEEEEEEKEEEEKVQ